MTKHTTGTANVCKTTAGDAIVKEGDEGLTLYGSHMKGKTISLTSKQGVSICSRPWAMTMSL
ncbi:MAG: hypothetical protein KF798_06595 [Candidatus Paracaedibacteraceae bacterium]|nr:hypothetical protein [Candidatus Paracaedibacteraceae bacterium]